MKPENAYTNLELQPLPYVLLLTSAAPSSRQGPVSCWYLLFCRAPWTSTVYTYIKVAPMVLPPGVGILGTWYVENVRFVLERNIRIRIFEK
jgi:hypothetical protein